MREKYEQKVSQKMRSPSSSPTRGRPGENPYVGPKRTLMAAVKAKQEQAKEGRSRSPSPTRRGQKLQTVRAEFLSKQVRLTWVRGVPEQAGAAGMLGTRLSCSWGWDSLVSCDSSAHTGGSKAHKEGGHEGCSWVHLWDCWVQLRYCRCSMGSSVHRTLALCWLSPVLVV